MKQNEIQVLLWIHQVEGGWAQRPEEPGGAVNMGVTLDTFTDWRTKIKKMPPPTIDDLKNLTWEECDDIYRHLFFDPVKFDQLPSGVDYCVVDAAVHSGVSGSIRFLQEALGFKHKDEYPNWTGHLVTGRWNADTLWALGQADPRSLIFRLVAVRRVRQKMMLVRKQQTIPNFNTALWERGWSMRNARVLTRALTLLEGSESEHVA